jgi:hypothetical protein
MSDYLRPRFQHKVIAIAVISVLLVGITTALGFGLHALRKAKYLEAEKKKAQSQKETEAARKKILLIKEIAAAHLGDKFEMMRAFAMDSHWPFSESCDSDCTELIKPERLERIAKEILYKEAIDFRQEIETQKNKNTVKYLTDKHL